MATLIRTDGTTEEVAPANGKSFTLAEIQGYVGGYFEVLGALDGKHKILVDEDGLRKSLEPNLAASFMVYGPTWFQPVVGPALLVTKKEMG